MATLNVRKHGTTWQYYFEGAKIDGKRNRIVKGGFSQKKDALMAGNKALNEYNNAGVAFKSSEISVSDYLDLWMKQYCETNLKSTTISSYKKIIKLYILPNLGKYKLNSVNGATLQTFITSLYEQEYSRNTLMNIKGILTNSFRYAVVPLKLIQQSPMEYVTVPKSNNKTKSKESPHVYIPKEKIDEIFNRFPEGSSVYIPLILGYKCGLRLGEAFAVTWDDIDIENKLLTVNYQTQWSKEKQQWYLTPPKYNSVRNIDLDDKLIELLQRTKDKQLKAKTYYNKYYKQLKIDKENYIGDIGKDINFINVREDGGIIQPRTMQHTSMIIHTQLNYPEFDFHSLRHTHCTSLLENGFSLKYVQNRMGHKNINVTLNIYNHLTSNQIDKDKSRLNNLF